MDTHTNRLSQKIPPLITSTLTLIREHSLQAERQDGSLFSWAHEKRIDWAIFEEAIYKDLEETAKHSPVNLIDIYGILNRALYRLDDGGHSRIDYRNYFLRFGDKAENERLMNGSWPEQRRFIESHLATNKSLQEQDTPPPHIVRKDAILYIEIPSFSGGANLNDLNIREDSEDSVRRKSSAQKRWIYENTILESLQSCHREKTDCIILDLRDNRGGYLTPMLYALLPLLTDSTQNNESAIMNIRYREKNEPLDIIEIAKRNGPPDLLNRVHAYYHPKLETIPVALLCGEKTCSAGEFILLSFRGRKNTKSFGQKTGGVSTWTYHSDTALGNGARLHIVNGLMRDRAHKGNGSSIPPDQEIEKNASPQTILTEIKNWLALTIPRNPVYNLTTPLPVPFV